MFKLIMNKTDKDIQTIKGVKIAFFTIWLIAVFSTVTLAVIPAEHIPTQPGSDKMLHLLAFCLLMIWPTTTLDYLKNAIFCGIFLLFVGIGIEILQSFIPSRTAEFMDVVYNVGGAIGGFIIGYLFRDSYQALLPASYVNRYLSA